MIFTDATPRGRRRSARPAVLVLLLAFSLAACSESDDWKKGKVVPQKEYTKDSPREWASIAPEHVPAVRKSRDRNKDAILIELPGLSTSREHYIERFGVLDSEGKELGSTPVDLTAVPKNFGFIPLNENMHGKMKAYAKCNLHDLWVTEFELP